MVVFAFVLKAGYRMVVSYEFILSRMGKIGKIGKQIVTKLQCFYQTSPKPYG
jgi:hypothetical protein